MMEIGFWSDEVVPEPSDAAADATVLRYLRGDFRRATAVRSVELGPSWCRLGCFDGVCHHEMGAATLCSVDGALIWPEGYAHYVARHGVRPPKALADAAAEAATAALASPAATSADWLLFDECEQRAVPMPAATREHMVRTTTLASKELSRRQGGGAGLKRTLAAALVALFCAWCLGHVPRLCAIAARGFRPLDAE